jgi:hypothetical protein
MSFHYSTDFTSIFSISFYVELILENQQTWRKENSDLKESLETMKKRYGT